MCLLKTPRSAKMILFAADKDIIDSLNRAAVHFVLCPAAFACFMKEDSYECYVYFDDPQIILKALRFYFCS